MSFGTFDVVEVVLFVAHLIGISQGQTHEPFAASFKRNDMLARGEYHFCKRHHPLLADSLSYHGECLLPDLTVRDDVVRIVKVELVDIRPGNELINVYDALALQRDGLKLFRLELDVFALTDFVAFDDVVRANLAAGLGVNLRVLDPVAGLLVQLMETDLLAFRTRRKQRDRARRLARA